MDGQELQLLQSLPLDIKVAKTKQRIREAVRYFGIDGVYISFSGGKDSTVLLDIARSVFPEIKACYCNTGLEYPEIFEFVKQFENVDIIRPSKNFKQVLTESGYPVVSKEQSKYIKELRTTKSEKLRNLRLYGNEKGQYKLSDKWKFLLDAPFKISDQCCYFMKKAPFKKYEKESGRHVPILGTLADESNLRRSTYLKEGGCNAFHLKHPKSSPIGFWRETDVLEYIVQNNLPIAPCYGEIKKNPETGEYYMDGVDRTGCVFCAYGLHMERKKPPHLNKFQKLAKSHPQLYAYIIGGGETVDGMIIPSKDGLGFGKVLDFLGEPY